MENATLYFRRICLRSKFTHQELVSFCKMFNLIPAEMIDKRAEMLAHLCCASSIRGVLVEQGEEKTFSMRHQEEGPGLEGRVHFSRVMVGVEALEFHGETGNKFRPCCCGPEVHERGILHSFPIGKMAKIRLDKLELKGIYDLVVEMK